MPGIVKQQVIDYLLGFRYEVAAERRRVSRKADDEGNPVLSAGLANGPGVYEGVRDACLYCEEFVLHYGPESVDVPEDRRPPFPVTWKKPEATADPAREELLPEPEN